ncbi:ribonuclease PH [Oscillochloris sp. ZM17-4]|uniref:ribonuclease PH n=1 Tax=Oscillochloris sp. ZM17-4 TaxID=2866714 RepID=UPI001C735D35|nr:ribonuclease PH [Oscillochloris sp. ZM17-4]MBX0327582.1 ribonuclease PH [Oscillochloris sp. ZM17-4]
MARHDGRMPDELRTIEIIPGYAPYAEGSALIAFGNTRVLCAASLEDHVPGWLRGQGRGWVSGEYALLPRSTHTRTRRERTGAGGRTQEIQRLIGRALRAAVSLEALGERLITIDCDVLQADGGTRTAAITGGYVALALALRKLQAEGRLPGDPLARAVAAVSVGVVGGELLLDLDYSEDSCAEMDCNVVQTDSGAFVEVQGTAEGAPVERAQLDALLDLAGRGVRQLIAAQRAALDAAP